MKRSETIICSVVGFLGLVAAALAFAAEAKHIRANQVTLTPEDTCIYPKSAALQLGIISALALLVAQLIVNISAGCLCCARGRSYGASSNRTIAIICLVVSWITFGIAFVLLMAGAALNDQHYANMRNFDNYCYVVKSGVFAGGAVLALATVTLGIFYYITASAVKKSAEWGPQNQNIAMAQPQYGQSSLQPVFVPENVNAQYSEYPQYPYGSQQPPHAGHTQRAPWK